MYYNRAHEESWALFLPFFSKKLFNIHLQIIGLGFSLLKETPLTILTYNPKLDLLVLSLFYLLCKS